MHPDRTAEGITGLKPDGSGMVSILYHSGTGGTKIVAELIADILSKTFRVNAIDIYNNCSQASSAESDFLVFCFPTYYLRPSPSMTEFIARLPRFSPEKPAYLVATAELYTENCIRSCALALKEHGITVTGSIWVRAPGSDVTVLVPSWLCRWMYRYERSFHTKLLSAAAEIERLARSGFRTERIPRVKLYTPFAQVLQILFFNRLDAWRHKFRVLQDRCVGCGVCVSECPRDAWTQEDDTLRHEGERCELCTRCIHRCPNKAIVLAAWLKDNPRLDRKLFRKLKAEAQELLHRG